MGRRTPGLKDGAGSADADAAAAGARIAMLFDAMAVMPAFSSRGFELQLATTKTMKMIARSLEFMVGSLGSVESPSPAGVVTPSLLDVEQHPREVPPVERAVPER